jgi:hypothetical protein
MGRNYETACIVFEIFKYTDNTIIVQFFFKFLYKTEKTNKNLTLLTKELSISTKRTFSKYYVH